MAIDPFDYQKIYTGVSRRGLWRSTNGGSSWERLPLGLPDTVLSVRSIAFSELHPGEVFCGWGWRSRSELSRSLDGGFTWTSLEFPGVPGQLAVSSDSNILYVGSSAGVYRRQILSGVGDEGHANQYHLYQNFPNPFNSRTIIRFRLARRGTIDLRLYDILGRDVRRIAHGGWEAGEHTIVLEADDLASGVYFYSISSESFFAVRRMTLIR
jgi:hypothetical protein